MGLGGKRLVCGLLLALLPVAAHAAPPKPGKVIWICIDALRAENLHFMGYDRATSPNIDGLAGKSVVFRMAVSPSNATIRSVPAYMTGMYPSEIFHDPMKDHWLSDKFTTLAEAFKASGYATYWFTTNGNASIYGNHNQGVDKYLEIFSRTMLKPSIDEVIHMIESMDAPVADRSFVYLHLNDVHDPYRPPIPFDRMFNSTGYTGKNVREGFLMGNDGDRIFSNLPDNMQTTVITDDDIRFMVDLYDGAIRYVDDRLPRLLKALHFDDTKDVLIFSADHGDQFFEDGFCGHGRTLRSQDFHVPLIVRYAGFAAHSYNDPVSLLDLYPTLAEWCGLQTPQGLRGTSLMPALTGEKDSGVTPGAIGDPVDWGGHGVVLAAGHYWYALNTEAFILRPWVATPYLELLFDTSTDPTCKVNVASTQTDALDQCNELMRKLFERMGPYSRDIIQQGANENDAGGPNLLDAVPENRTAFAKFGRTLTPVVAHDTVALKVERAKTVLTARTNPNYKMHMLQVQVGQKDAHIKIEIRRAKTNYTTFSREYWAPRDFGDLPILIVFETSSPETQIVITAIGEGECEVGWPLLRELNYETVYPARWPIQDQQPESDTNKPGLNDAEQERLKALGYL